MELLCVRSNGTKEPPVTPPDALSRKCRATVHEVGSTEERTAASFESEIAAIQRLLGTSFAENADLRKEVERLEAELDEQELIHYAAGIIMGRLDVDARSALALLQKGADADHSKLRVAAAAVVAARRTPSEIAAG